MASIHFTSKKWRKGLGVIKMLVILFMIIERGREELGVGGWMVVS
jgi:hypothetical protein